MNEFWARWFHRAAKELTFIAIQIYREDSIKVLIECKYKSTEYLFTNFDSHALVVDFRARLHYNCRTSRQYSSRMLIIFCSCRTAICRKFSFFTNQDLYTCKTAGHADVLFARERLVNRDASFLVSFASTIAAPLSAAPAPMWQTCSIVAAILPLVIRPYVLLSSNPTVFS